MIEFLGWISSFLLAACGFPLMVSSIRRKSSVGISKIFLWTWFIGEVLGLFYVIYLGKQPLIFNYGLNTIFLLPVVYFSCFPKKPVV